MSVWLNGNITQPFQIVGLPAESPDPMATGLPLVPNGPPVCTELCADGKCCLVGQAASFGVTGIQNEFVIVARDRYGNEITKGGESFSIDVVGNTVGEGSVKDLGLGQYLARYRVLTKGLYTLSIRMRGIHIGMLYDDCPGIDKQCFLGSPFQNLLVSPRGTGLEGLIISGDLGQETNQEVCAYARMSVRVHTYVCVGMGMFLKAWNVAVFLQKRLLISVLLQWRFVSFVLS
jgi:hypothetical protein